MSATLHCASFGRLDKPHPEGAKPVCVNGQGWCSWCAAIHRTQSGHTYVETPGPGCMTDGTDDDPLSTWKDCYVMKPIKRIRKDAAKTEINGRGPCGTATRPVGSPCSSFSFGSRDTRPYFLTFRVIGDPWQTIHSWLIQYEDGQRKSIGS
jgi:hypothetical protein